MEMSRAHCHCQPSGVHRVPFRSCAQLAKPEEVSLCLICRDRASMGPKYSNSELMWGGFLIIMPVARGTGESHTHDLIWFLRSGLISSLVLTAQSDRLGGNASILWYGLNQSEWNYLVPRRNTAGSRQVGWNPSCKLSSHRKWDSFKGVSTEEILYHRPKQILVSVLSQCPQLPEQSFTPFLLSLNRTPFFAYTELPNTVFMMEGQRAKGTCNTYQKISFHLIMKSLTSDPGVAADQLSSKIKLIPQDLCWMGILRDSWLTPFEEQLLPNLIRSHTSCQLMKERPREKFKVIWDFSLDHPLWTCPAPGFTTPQRSLDFTQTKSWYNAPD